MASANYDISHEQGTDFVLNINYYDDQGNAIDMSDGRYWAKMDVRGQKYENDPSDSSLKIRFSTGNTYGETFDLDTLENRKKAGHISLNGEFVYSDDSEGATSSNITGQISLSFTKQVSRHLPSGSFLYDFFLYRDRGISSGSTADALAERLVAGKFIISPSISNPEFDS